MIKLPTEKISGNILLELARWLIFGAPKIGKTTLCSGWPDTLFLATEKGYLSHKVYVKDVKSWINFVDINKEVLKGNHKFKTIVIDTVDLLFKMCVDHVCDDLDIAHVSDESYGKGYDIVANTFELELNKLFSSKYGVILVSHTKTSELTNKAGRYTKISSSLSNQARRVILPKVDIVGYMKLKSIKNKDGELVDKRIISFEPNEFEEAGDRTGKLPHEVIVSKNPHKTYETIKSYF